MIAAVEASLTRIYEAVVALSRSIAGRSDLESLLSGVAESLRRIVYFETVGLSLHDVKANRMQACLLRYPGGAATNLCLPVDEDPAGWVWLNQRPLVIRSLDEERRWPEFARGARGAGVIAITVVPLTAGTIGWVHSGSAAEVLMNPARPNWRFSSGLLQSLRWRWNRFWPGRKLLGSETGLKRCSTLRMRWYRNWRQMNYSPQSRSSSRE